MMLVGLELEVEELAHNIRMTAALSFCGLSLPGVGAYLLALYFEGDARFTSTSYGILGLFLTCAMGISALPVLARILKARNMIDTTVGRQCIALASLDDLVAWILLAVVIALVRLSGSGEGGTIDVLWIVLATVAESLFVFYPLRFAMDYFVEHTAVNNSSGTLNEGTFFFFAFCLIFGCWLTDAIGISPLIGALQIGLIVPRRSSLGEGIRKNMEMFITTIFMPIYFCNSGLKTQFGLINDGESIGICLLLVTVANVCKFSGVCECRRPPPRPARPPRKRPNRTRCCLQRPRHFRHSLRRAARHAGHPDPRRRADGRAHELQG